MENKQCHVINVNINCLKVLAGEFLFPLIFKNCLIYSSMTNKHVIDKTNALSGKPYVIETKN